MLSPYLYECIILKTGSNTQDVFRDTSQATKNVNPCLGVLSDLIRVSPTDRHVKPTSRSELTREQ